MIKVKKYGVILSATEKEFESKGVLNPGVYQDGETVHLLYRALGEGSFSSIGYAKTKGALKIVDRFGKPLIMPELDYEKNGVQDAKIVKIEDTFYVTYRAYDGINTLGVLATSKDLIHFEKKGVISPRINYPEYKRCITNKKNAGLNPKYLYYYNLFSEIGIVADENRLLSIKDVTLFPRKINGKFAMLIGIWPGVQIVYFDDFADLTKEFWIKYLENLSDYIVLDPKSVFEVNHLGVGGPPLETEHGWIMIYYGVQETTSGKNYSAKCALLDLDKPEKEIARLDDPILAPTKLWEIKDRAEAIVIPSGHALFGDDLYIYYGAADKGIAVAKLQLHELLKELLKSGVKE